MPTQTTACGRAIGGPIRSPSMFSAGRAPPASASRTPAMPPPARKAPSMSLVRPDRLYAPPWSSSTTGRSAPGAPTRMNRKKVVLSGSAPPRQCLVGNPIAFRRRHTSDVSVIIALPELARMRLHQMSEPSMACEWLENAGHHERVGVGVDVGEAHSAVEADRALVGLAHAQMDTRGAGRRETGQQGRHQAAAGALALDSGEQVEVEVCRVSLDHVRARRL